MSSRTPASTAVRSLRRLTPPPPRKVASSGGGDDRREEALKQKEGACDGSALGFLLLVFGSVLIETSPLKIDFSISS
jgi:hypothetical protein